MSLLVAVVYKNVLMSLLVAVVYKNVLMSLLVAVIIDNRGGGGIGNAIRMNGECLSRSRDHEMFAIFFVKDGYIPVWFDLR